MNNSTRVADELKKSEGFLDSVIENIPNMIFVKDARDLRFVRFNRAGEELLGYSRDDLIGKNDYDLFPTEQADFFTSKDREVLQCGEMVDIPEEQLISRVLGVRTLHTKKIPIFDVTGNPVYLLGISEDVTEKMKSEEQRLNFLAEQVARNEAEKTAQRFSFLFEASTTLSHSLDQKAVLNSLADLVVQRFADSCFFELADNSGQLRSAALNAKLLEPSIVLKRLREDVPPRVEVSALAPLLQEGRVVSIQSPEFQNLVGQPFLSAAEVSGVPLRSGLLVALGARQKVFGYALFASFTANRVYNDLDMDLAKELAKRVSFMIENAQLYEKAQEANRAKSAFLANMSHEIRTPLGAMLGYAELMLDSNSLTEEHQDSISTIIRNGRQLLRIVDEILDLSKVESQHVVMEKIRFSPRKLISDVTALLRVKAKEKGLQLELSLTPEVPEVVVSDPTRLRQILLNVIGNAIKFTEKGLVEVRVAARGSANDARFVRLEFLVRDSGIGITEEQANQLFKPFSQADSSMARKYGGTGLGLFLSRKLAQALNGDLTLKESNPKSGSTFALEIEAEVSQSFVPTESPLSKPLDGAMSNLRCSRVLVIDDAPDNRFLMRRLLERAGVTVDLAGDGKEGVEKALSTSYDVIFMDLQMPVMDGFSAVKSLREQKYSKPIVALTAHAMKGDRERCLDAGFNDHLPKPVNRRVVQETLARYENQTPK